MGEEVTTTSKPIIAEVGEQGQGRGSTGSESSPNARTERGNTRGHSRGDRTDTGKGKEEKEKLPRLSSLEKKEGETEEQYKKRLERNEKKRQRYQEQKANGTLKQAKPKKVNKKKQEEINTEQLNTFIKTVSTLIATRPNCSHWLLSDTEIESITTPLAKMLQESNVFNKIGEHSNQIALVTACITVFMPRIITTTLLIKEKKKNERRSIKPQSSQSKVVDINRKDDKRYANDNKNVSTDTSWLDTIVY